jgi:hypothetical protein
LKSTYRKSSYILALLLVLCNGGIFFGQPASVPTPSGGGMPPPPPSLPVDDFIVSMLILSIFYGLYTINDKIKTKTPR